MARRRSVPTKQQELLAFVCYMVVSFNVLSQHQDPFCSEMRKPVMATDEAVVQEFLKTHARGLPVEGGGIGCPAQRAPVMRQRKLSYQSSL